MGNGERVIEFPSRENIRQQRFNHVWEDELNDVFADVAPYYDRANIIASLGLWHWFRNRFIATIDVQSRQKVLDLCAGTNAIGIALLKKQPDLQVHAMDRSKAMQAVGQQAAGKLGFTIDSTIGDVSQLPFPDNHFDVVTLQYASRHLPIMTVCREAMRVLKPGGHFYHCDMLRPSNRFVAWSYYTFLKITLNVTALLFGSSRSAHGCKQYFIDALRLFYSAEEFTELLTDVGYRNITHETLLGGMIGYHRAMKPAADG